MIYFLEDSMFSIPMYACVMNWKIICCSVMVLSKHRSIFIVLIANVSALSTKRHLIK